LQTGEEGTYVRHIYVIAALKCDTKEFKDTGPTHQCLFIYILHQNLEETKS